MYYAMIYYWASGDGQMEVPEISLYSTREEALKAMDESINETSPPPDTVAVKTQHYDEWAQISYQGASDYWMCWEVRKVDAPGERTERDLGFPADKNRRGNKA